MVVYRPIIVHNAARCLNLLLCLYMYVEVKKVALIEGGPQNGCLSSFPLTFDVFSH